VMNGDGGNRKVCDGIVDLPGLGKSFLDFLDLVDRRFFDPVPLP
jgi:hypothetical protein